MSDVKPSTEPTDPLHRRRWRAPSVRTAAVGEPPVLLCATGTPYSCFGGACCDVSPDCDQVCQGG